MITSYTVLGIIAVLSLYSDKVFDGFWVVFDGFDQLFDGFDQLFDVCKNHPGKNSYFQPLKQANKRQ
jgi:hypothetical protein